jgi:hypothetical protein
MDEPPPTNESLEVLPEECLVAVATFLSPKDVGQLGMTSRRFHQLTNDPLLWKSICMSQFPELVSLFHTRETNDDATNIITIGGLSPLCSTPSSSSSSSGPGSGDPPISLDSKYFAPKLVSHTSMNGSKEWTTKVKMNEKWNKWKRLYLHANKTYKAWYNKPTEQQIQLTTNEASSVCLDEGLLYLSSARKVCCVDLEGKLLGEYRIPQGLDEAYYNLAAIQVSNAQDLIAVSKGPNIHIWKLHTKEHTFLETGFSGSLWAVRFDATKLVCAGEASKLGIFDLTTLQSLVGSGLVSGHQVTIRSARFIYNLLATGGELGDNSVKLWDFRDLRKPCAQFTDWKSGVWCLDISQDKLAGGSEKRINVYDLRAGGDVLWQHDAHGDHINMVQFDDFKLVSAGGDPKVKVYDMDTFVERSAFDLSQRAWVAMYEENVFAAVSSSTSRVSVLNFGNSKV